MDTWTSASVRIPRQLLADSTYPKPMEETQFEIYSQVIRLNDDTVHRSQSQLQILECVNAIAQALDNWVHSLPTHLRNTPQNMRDFADRGLGRSFVALHLGYYHNSQLLYYQFLHQSISGPAHHELAYIYATRCKDHAAELSNLLWTSNSTSGLEYYLAINGHCLVIASSVHLHTLLFEIDENRISVAKSMLGQNFEMLLQLQKYWPSLEFTISRLRAFHCACQASMHATFDMDRWMLHFLQEWASPVSDGFSEAEGFPSFATPESACFDYASDLQSVSGLDILQTFLWNG